MKVNNPNLDLFNNINVYTKFCEILSIHSQDIKQKRNSDIYQGPNSVTNSLKMTVNNPNLDLVLIMHIQNLVKLCPLNFVLKILSGNKILTPFKGRNSVTNLRKIMVNNPNLDLVNTNVTRWTKQAFPCSKFLSPGVSFGSIHHHRGFNSIESGYLNFTARLTYFLFTLIMALKGTIKSFFTKLHNWT